MTRAEDGRSKLSLRRGCGGFRGAKPTMVMVLQDEAKTSHARRLLADHHQTTGSSSGSVCGERASDPGGAMAE
jgi:polyribonucleotide nucleotidyltransferase